MFDIVCSKYQNLVFQTGMIDEVACMYPFKQNRAGIIGQIPDKFTWWSCYNNVGQRIQIILYSGVPLIIVNFFTENFKLRTPCASILETVQNNLYTKLFQGSDFMVNIDYSAIVRRIRYIEGNDM